MVGHSWVLYRENKGRPGVGPRAELMKRKAGLRRGVAQGHAHTVPPRHLSCKERSTLATRGMALDSKCLEHLTMSNWERW